MAKWVSVCCVLLSVAANTGTAAEELSAATGDLARELDSLRLAIVDLTATFPDQYRRGPEFLQRLDAVARRAGPASAEVRGEVTRLKEEALLANPLITFDRLIVLKRKRGQLGLPTNHQCNTALKQTAYDNEIAVLSPVRPDGQLHTLYQPDGRRFVGEIDLHYEADRLLFTMPNGQTWQIHEIVCTTSMRVRAWQACRAARLSDSASRLTTTATPAWPAPTRSDVPDRGT